MNLFPITGMRGSMQQGWSPQRPMGGSAGPVMGQGVGPGRMVPNMNAALPARGSVTSGSRAMVNMQMMGNGKRKWANNRNSSLLEFYIVCYILCIFPLQRWTWQHLLTLSSRFHLIRLLLGQTEW